MSRQTIFRRWWSERLEEARLHLSRPDALLQLALLGLVTGLLAGAAIVLFRLGVEGSQDLLLPGRGAENYEALPTEVRFVLPILGAVLLAALFRWASGGLHVLGVARVLERMAYHQGHLTARGFVLQFIGAALAIISGHSVGREGPHVYLGAAAGSLFGQRLSLPNNSIRTLVGCGAAAGIAASFNTPLAGVVFSLEVVMMEYTLASFIPVMLAAVGATVLSNAILGSEPAFSVPELALGSLAEVPVVVLLGLSAGACAAAFIALIQSLASRSRPLAIWWRVLLAGIGMGGVGMLVPEVMGIGYDTVDAALLGEISVHMLLLILAAKMLATSLSVGLGVPGGMIGPSLFMGALLGSLAGHLAALLPLELHSNVGAYALIGMASMMGASLQAPLAAVTAMMELTHSPGVIMPGMLAVVVAALTASELFRKESLFIAMLRSAGLDYSSSPVLQALRRVGVASVMAREFVRLPRQITAEEGERLLGQDPRWIVVDDGEQPRWLMPAVELARYLRALPPETVAESVDLLEIPAEHRMQLAPVYLQATLQEALDILDAGEAEALYVERTTAPGIQRLYGILTRSMVESVYRY